MSSEGIAFPRGVVANDTNLFSVLSDIIAKEKVERVIVGDTRSYSGLENPITKEAENFVVRLKAASGLAVHFVREAGSSVEASRHASSKQKDDAAAAALILQRYLDAESAGVD